jgi:hypothetical protein
MEVWANSAWKYWLDLRTFVAEKLPDNGTLVPKHVGVVTWYEVCFVMFLGAFVNLRIISYVMSIRPSVHTEQQGSHWMDVH